MRIVVFSPADGFPAALLAGLLILGVLNAVLSVSTAAAGEIPKPASLEAWTWRRLGVTVRAVSAGAIAVDPERGLLAAGDERGVWLLAEGGAKRQLTRCGAVLDLAFAMDGTLWVAASGGLHRVALPAAPGAEGAAADFAQVAMERVRLALGRGNLGIQRVGISAGAMAVASERGVYVSRMGQRWLKLPNALPVGAVASLALRRRADSWQLLADIDGQIWEVDFRWLPEGGVALDSVRRQAIPFSGLRFDTRDLFYAQGSEPFDAVAFGSTHIAIRREPAGPWRAERLRLPPGVLPLRGSVGANQLWLATDRGLFRRPAGRDRWELLLAATDHSLVAGVRELPERVLFIGERGLFEGRHADTSSALVPGRATLPLRFAEEPSIEEVRRAALTYLDLDPKWMRALRKGVRRRGYLPEVDLRFDGGRRWIDGDNYDESFSYGELHALRDWDAEQMSEAEVSLTFSWNLRDLAYDPESLDVSDEAREVMKLRDDVLDELSQLFYDRRRLLLELDQLSEGAPPSEAGGAEGVRLRLRADELAAGIDAWTGGWFSERVPRLAEE